MLTLDQHFRIITDKLAISVLYYHHHHHKSTDSCCIQILNYVLVFSIFLLILFFEDYNQCLALTEKPNFPSY